MSMFGFDSKQMRYLLFFMVGIFLISCGSDENGDCIGQYEFADRWEFDGIAYFEVTSTGLNQIDRAGSFLVFEDSLDQLYDEFEVGPIIALRILNFLSTDELNITTFEVPFTPMSQMADTTISYSLDANNVISSTSLGGLNETLRLDDNCSNAYWGLQIVASTRFDTQFGINRFSTDISERNYNKSIEEVAMDGSQRNSLNPGDSIAVLLPEVVYEKQ